MGRPFNADLPAESDRRARWYRAGAIQGLARSKSWSRIVEAWRWRDAVARWVPAPVESRGLALPDVDREILLLAPDVEAVGGPVY